MEKSNRLRKQVGIYLLLLCFLSGLLVNLNLNLAYGKEGQVGQTTEEEVKQSVKKIALGGAAFMMSNSDSQEQATNIEKVLSDTIKKVDQEAGKEKKSEIKKTKLKKTETKKTKSKKTETKRTKSKKIKTKKEKSQTSKKEKTVKASISVDQLLAADVDVALNLREKPNTRCDITGKLYRGGAAKILQKKGKWYQVKSGKVTGWVRQDLVKVKAKAEKLLKKVNPKVATVTGKYVNVRKKKSTDSDVVAVVKSGSSFMCLKKSSEWTKVQLTPDEEGYIFNDYVTVKKDYGTAVSSKTLNKYVKAVNKKKEERRAKMRSLEAGSDSSDSSSGGSSSVGDSEFMILAAICEREAGSQYDNCLAVANVVLNRVNSSAYPNSISGVVFQSGQFCSYGTLSKYLNRGPNSTAISAARAALNGSNNIGSRKSFRWIHSSGAYNHSNCVTIGDNVFF